MRYFFALFFACAAVFLWKFVRGFIASGVVQMPKANSWWREARYYERDSTPVRFWLTVALWVALALITTALPVVCVTTDDFE